MEMTSEETKNMVRELDKKFESSIAFDKKMANALKLYTAITERLDAMCEEPGVTRDMLGLEISGWAALMITQIPDDKIPGLSRLAFDNDLEMALVKHFGVCTVRAVPTVEFDEVSFNVVRHTPGYLLLTEIVKNIAKQTATMVVVTISKEGESIINTMEEWESLVYGMPRGMPFVNGMGMLTFSELPCIFNPDTGRLVFWFTELSEETGFFYRIHDAPETDPNDPGYKKFADALEKYLNKSKDGEQNEL